MDTDIRNDCIAFVLFGATGNLSLRLILPALFNLFLDGYLPERFRLVAVDHDNHDDDHLRDLYHRAVTEHSRRQPADGDSWRRFAAMCEYHRLDLLDESGYGMLHERLEQQATQWCAPLTHLFYMATPPSLFVPIARGLAAAGLGQAHSRTRLVVEKPMGHDLDSFRALNDVLCSTFTERQIFRMDHFLGKETVQNVLAMRFANPIFEPIWNRRYIDHIAITVAENAGIGSRGGYYDSAGALRDMIQNHLLQLLCLVAMEPPVVYGAEDIRNRKMEVLRAIRPIAPDRVSEFAARGQYQHGWNKGEEVAGYREEAGIAPDSNTETYAALKLYVDNWRWQDVPFYLRTGKRLSLDVAEISVRFRDVPHHAFPDVVGLNAEPARLVIQLQPEQGIVLKFMAKEPGFHMRLRPVAMRFSYREAFRAEVPAAYETLLWDVMAGDSTLFMRADQVEAAWKLVEPVLNAWLHSPAPDFPNYAVGSWGPESAEALVARDGHSWMAPTH